MEVITGIELKLEARGSTKDIVKALKEIINRYESDHILMGMDKMSFGVDIEPHNTLELKNQQNKNI
jgi:hypothetical protein